MSNNDKVVIPRYPLALKDKDLECDDVYLLGDEVFVYTHNLGAHEKLDGKMVCKIAGVDGSIVPGYHFTNGWVTVCPIDAEHAKWYGVRSYTLTLLNQQ